MILCLQILLIDSINGNLFLRNRSKIMIFIVMIYITKNMKVLYFCDKFVKYMCTLCNSKSHSNIKIEYKWTYLSKILLYLEFHIWKLYLILSLDKIRNCTISVLFSKINNKVLRYQPTWPAVYTLNYIWASAMAQ